MSRYVWPVTILLAAVVLAVAGVVAAIQFRPVARTSPRTITKDVPVIRYRTITLAAPRPGTEDCWAGINPDTGAPYALLTSSGAGQPAVSGCVIGNIRAVPPLSNAEVGFSVTAPNGDSSTYTASP